MRTSSFPPPSAVPPIPSAPRSSPQRPVPPLPPSPELPELIELARAHPERGWLPGAPVALARNAHYTNSRTQLAYALRGEYNSLEGDVRLRDGVPVMAHGGTGGADLSFEQWATVVRASGRLLRIDVKDASALAPVARVLERLGIDSGRISFNVSALQPWMSANLPIARIRALRARFPRAMLSLNTPVPLGPGYDLVAYAARQIGGRVGIALHAPLVTADLVQRLKRDLVVNVWNLPQIWEPTDPVAMGRRLRMLGVDGMIDLRRRDDPLARP